MGVKIYYYLVIAVLVFGMLMPQKGKKRIYYIILMALIHAFVCGFRYMYLTGDLRKYAASYNQMEGMAWTSESVLRGGKNVGFGLLLKLLSTITHGDFQILLIVIAVITELALAMLVYRYSPRPWMSYLVWDCLSFYIFGFSAIKQALAMSVLMWAVTGILERKPKKFLLFAVIAGLIHMPAFAFLPAYWIAKRRVTGDTILFAVAAAVAIFFLRTQIVAIISPLYYEEETFVLGESGLGMRFFFIIGLLAVGILIKGFEERDFSALFHLIVISAILQMFSGFDNVFTRMADYYFQFSVLYIPLLFLSSPGDTRMMQNGPYGARAVFRTDPKIKAYAVFFTVALLMLYYYKTQLSATILYDVDNYLNYRFMWTVVN